MCWMLKLPIVTKQSEAAVSSDLSGGASRSATQRAYLPLKLPTAPVATLGQSQFGVVINTPLLVL